MGHKGSHSLEFYYLGCFKNVFFFRVYQGFLGVLLNGIGISTHSSASVKDGGQDLRRIPFISAIM